MPQITLKLSKNIDITQFDFQKIFAAIHDVLADEPKIDITTCHSGVVHENFSYIGLGDEKFTKVYLEVYWLENEERLAVKKQTGQKLMKILEDNIVPQVEQQKLICIPRVRVMDLGKVDQEYHISKRKPV